MFASKIHFDKYFEIVKDSRLSRLSKNDLQKSLVNKTRYGRLLFIFQHPYVFICLLSRIDDAMYQFFFNAISILEDDTLNSETDTQGHIYGKLFPLSLSQFETLTRFLIHLLYIHFIAM